MAVDIGPRIGIKGEAEYRKEMNRILSETKTLNAEMKAMESAWDKDTSAKRKATQQSESLTRQITLQSQRVAELESGLAECSAKYGENDTRTLKWRQAVANATTELNRLRNELAKVPNKLELFGQSMQATGQKIKRAGSSISSVGTTLTKSITAPVLAAGGAAVKLASDYDENLNKVDESFQDSAGEVKAWAKTATKNFGMSESAALEVTSLFGDMGTSMELNTKEAAKMSTELAGLAGDLASFKNIDIDQAMTALKGVFTGETESLKTLGVVMTETNLKQFASDMGLVYNSMSQAEKVTLRYQYVLKNTKNAHGDYARTSDGMANSLRTMAAEASNLGAAFGKEILPYITPLIQKGTELIRKFASLDDQQKKTIIQMAALAAATGPVLTAVGKMTSGVGSAVEQGGKFIEWLGKATKGQVELAGAIPAVGIALAAAAGTALLMEAGFKKIREAARETNESLYDSIDAANSATSEMKTAGDELKTAFNNANDSIDTVIATSKRAQNIGDELAKLASKSKLTTEEQRRMKALVAELNSIYPEFNGLIDENTGKLNKSAEEIRTFVDEASKMAKLAAYQQALNDLTKELSDAYIAQAKAEMEVDRANKEMAASQSNLTTRMQELLNKKGELTAAEEFELGQLMAGTNAYTAEGQAVHNAAKAQIDFNNENEKLTKQMDDTQGVIDIINGEIDELTGSLNSNADAMETSETATQKTGMSFKNLAEFVASGTQKLKESEREVLDFYNQTYDSAKESIMGQTSLWDELEEQEETSVAAMRKNLQDHIAALASWNGNAAKLTSSTEYKTNKNFRAMVDNIIAAGQDMAPELQAIVDAYEAGDEELSALTEDYGEMSKLADQSAKATADAKTELEYGLAGMGATIDKSGVPKSAQKLMSDAYQKFKTGWTNIKSGLTNSGVPESAGKMMSDTGDAIKNYDLGKPATMAVRKVGNAKPEMQAQVKAVMNEFISSVKSQQPGMESAAGTAGSGSVGSMANAMWNNAKKVYDASVNLANQAKGPVSGLDGTSWGEHLAQSLANGMWNRAQAVWDAAKNLANAVASQLHFTHPDEGPLKSGTEIWGRHMAQDFASGMAMGIPDVRAAASGLASAAVIPTRTMLDIDAVSGANVAEPLTVNDIYDAFSAAISEQETKIVIGNREFGRILRDQGVA